MRPSLQCGPKAAAQRVTAVKNGQDPGLRPGAPSRMQVAEDLRVGGPGGPDDALLGDARSVAVDDAGRIFVLDYKRKVIVAFDADGRFERLIGRPGQGPGELQAPMRIMTTATGELAAEDHYAKRFTVYAPDGRYVRQIPFPPVFIFSTGIDSAGRIIGVVQTQESEGAAQVLQRYSADGRLLHSLGPVLRDRRGEYNYFRASLRWSIIGGDSVVWAFSDTYELSTYDGRGDLVRKIVKDHEPVPITGAELAEMRKVVRLPPGYRLIVPRRHPAFRDLTVDDEGRIYVQTYERPPDGRGFVVDVFDRDGLCFARVPLPITPLIWKKGKVYASGEDEQGHPFVARYSVQWE
jgi:hypothetical protein